MCVCSLAKKNEEGKEKIFGNWFNLQLGDVKAEPQLSSLALI